jgi:alpha-glucosidase
MTRITRGLLTTLLIGLLVSAAGAQVVAEAIGDRIVRFHHDADARDHALPSFALDGPRPAIGPAPEGFPVTPEFSTTEQGRVSFTIPIEPGTSLYGTGEVAGRLLRNGKRIICWNYDAYGYDRTATHLYQSHPWVLAVRADGTAFGVLADTTYKTAIDLTDAIRFTSDGPVYPVIIIDRDSPQEVVMALADLTGHMPMPPKWAIGYHQCRYSYEPDDRVREIAAGFRDRDIPCDVIWMDIDYMDGYRCFTFDPKGFPDPKALNKDLHDLGYHTVWMIDPGIKKEEGYSIYDQGSALDVWVQRADGTTYTGEVWPGECVFPDFTMAKTRTWWAGLYADFLANGIDGVWNDMNEPAVFNVPTKTMPVDNVHRADPEFGGTGPHARFHNVYGQLMITATREGVLAARPDKRPFVLSRDAYLGGQKYGAAWTGDNSATWDHLEMSVPMVLNLGLSGQPFAGPDIGGFAGNGDAGLFARWMGFGAMLPFARGHTGKGNIDKEPWAFDAETEATCKAAIERRYRLMPYYYTVFHEATQTGLPVARPLFFADPADPALRSEDDAFLIGSDLLVDCALTPLRDRVSTLPRGIWRRFDFGRGHDPDLPVMYARGGSIIPVGPVMEYVDEKPLDPLTLIVCLDADGRAEGALYEDAGDGFGYREGEYRLTRYKAERIEGIAGPLVRVTIAGVEGDLPRPAGRTVRLRVLLDNGFEATAEGAEAPAMHVNLQD